ncbi:MULTISPECIES: ABC transporter permease [Hungatella]|uniref:ABC transporter permease n=1 Tax=Hungatella TaxID=1649459 RepID=UPI0022E8CF80|nr:ABC transporter permease [Hungatella hathewayi]
MKKYRSLILIIFIGILLNLFFISNIKYDEIVQVKFSIALQSDKANDIQVFYSSDGNFTEEASIILSYNEVDQIQKLTYFVPDTTNWIRIDFGSTEAAFSINQMQFFLNNNYIDVTNSILQNCDTNMIDEVTAGATYNFVSTGNDAFCILNVTDLNISKITKEYRDSINQKHIFAVCMVLDLCLLGILIKKKKLSSLLKEFISNRSLILDLAINDFKTRYAGSYLGIVWAFVQPVVTILVYWFVFQVGFRSGTLKEVPFVLWLAAGLVPWFFFNEALNSATSSLIDYGYLVKKVVFNIRIIPFVKILSALFVHAFFVIFILLLYILNNIFPSIYWLQIVYYSGYMIILCLGITYVTSALMIFFRDLSQIINVFLQIGIWMTPIMWDIAVIPIQHQWILKLNPMYYVVEGYRNALIYHNWFWNDPIQTVYVWIIAIIMLLLGNYVFNKLKEYFADAL